MGSFVRSLGALCALLPLIAGAQARRVSGIVHRGTGTDARPVAAQWIVLHRVARDKAGPLDSIRSDAGGHYAFQYTRGADSAVYFASSTYGGVAYFTAPFATALVGSPEADITVFDTTSSGAPIALRSHHFIVFRTAEGKARRLSEVFWLENPGRATRVAVASAASFRAALPQGASDFRVDDGDIAAGAVKFENGVLEVFAPFAPGLRQLQISYDVTAKSFPMTVPVLDSTGVLEVLIEDAGGRARGAGLVPQQPVTVEQRSFQRYLAQAVRGSATFEISLPGRGPSGRALYVAGIIGIVGLGLLIGLARTVMRPGGLRIERPAGPERAEELAHAIAALDAKVVKAAKFSEIERAAHVRERDALKAELTTVLAERDDAL